MICNDCGWRGDIQELEPQIGEIFGNELCPGCRGMNVVDFVDRIDPNDNQPPEDEERCKRSGCDSPVYWHGLCNWHFNV